jgi:hypothetical protein
MLPTAVRPSHSCPGQYTVETNRPTRLLDGAGLATAALDLARICGSAIKVRSGVPGASQRHADDRAAVTVSVAIQARLHGGNVAASGCVHGGRRSASTYLAAT